MISLNLIQKRCAVFKFEFIEIILNLLRQLFSKNIIHLHFQFLILICMRGNQFNKFLKVKKVI